MLIAEQSEQLGRLFDIKSVLSRGIFGRADHFSAPFAATPSTIRIGNAILHDSGCDAELYHI